MSDNESTVRVPLTVEDRAGRADVMAGLLAEIEALDAEHKRETAEYRGNREALLSNLQAHGRVLREGAEGKSQMDLFVDQAGAPQALHDVAEHACTCPDPENPDNVSPACSVHGIGSPAADAARAARQAEAQDAEMAEAIQEADQAAPDAA